MCVFYIVNIWRIHSVSIDVRQICYEVLNMYKTCNKWHRTDVYGSSLILILFVHHLSITHPLYVRFVRFVF